MARKHSNPILSVRLDDQLVRQLDSFAKANKLSRSQAARELLRRVLTDADDVSRGWYEGKAEGLARVLAVVSDAVNELTPEG